MKRDDLETLAKKANKAVFEVRKKVYRVYEILKDMDMKLNHVIERNSEYKLLSKAIDYK